MDSVDTPSGRPPKDPYEYYLEKKEQPKKESNDLIAFLLKSIHDTVHFLQTKFQNNSSYNLDSTIEIQLKKLKEIFQMIQSEDLSRDIHLLNQLSVTWDQIISNPNAHSNTSLLHFLQEIKHYPKNEEFNFEYYLSKYAGRQKWYPIPYMKLIQELHEEHVATPKMSILQNWVCQIDRLLKTCVLVPPRRHS